MTLFHIFHLTAHFLFQYTNSWVLMECLQCFLFLLFLYFHSFSLPSFHLSVYFLWIFSYFLWFFFIFFILKSTEWPCSPSAWRKPKSNNQITVVSVVIVGMGSSVLHKFFFILSIPCFCSICMTPRVQCMYLSF